MEINQVIETYKNTVYSVALSYTRNVSDAEDIFQDVFLIYFKKNLRYNDENHRKAWLIRTTINRARKAVSKKRAVEINENITSAGNRYSFEFLLEKHNDIFRAMEKLPQIYRDALHLYYFEDLSTAQSAKILQTKESTFRVQLKRARELMRDILKEDYFYE
jgi:RNA polymerase sigma-70 factor (ECF subfamily)